MHSYEEGESCPADECSGKMEYCRLEDCSCHLNPPCWSCTNMVLCCDICSFEPEEGK